MPSRVLVGLTQAPRGPCGVQTTPHGTPNTSPFSLKQPKRPSSRHRPFHSISQRLSSFSTAKTCTSANCLS